MNRQLEGLEDVGGTYLFDVRTGVRRLRLNKFFVSLTRPENRAQFRADPDQAYRDAGLSDEEVRLLKAHDWLGLIRHGANFFAMEKYIRLVGQTNLEVYAAQRGETFEAFMKTRRVPDAR
jgi:protocatechuate 4,5-dioxygenase alpha chain